MGGGLPLAPAEPERRGRGRPKGSGNKRSKDLAGYVAARFGGSAAQQMAAVCMVTPAEVRQAGGVLEARLVKARELAKALHVDLVDAWKILAAELAQLAPYTDQRQPQAVTLDAQGMAPNVILMSAPPSVASLGGGVEKAEVFEGFAVEVSQPKSHGEGQAVDLPGLLAPPDAD